MFASPVAQKALRLLNGEENKEQNNHESDNSKSEVGDGRDAENLEEGEEGIKSRNRWTVVARTVAASPRARTRMGRRASLAPDNRCLTPAPPKFDRSRRMSLPPSRVPLLPSRSISPAPLEKIKKTSSNSNLEGTKSEGGLSKSNESGEHTLVKPPVVPEIPLSMFASPEAQKTLRSLNGEESEEQNNHESDNSKSEVDDGRDAENLEEGEEGIKSRYGWMVVEQTVAASPRARTRMGRRASVAPDHRCLSPAPPKFDRPRRTSLSPSRYPLLPSRPVSPAPPANSEKTSSKSNLEVTNTISSHEFKTKSQNSSCRPKIDVPGGNPAIARVLSRRRFSLPITPSPQLTFHHPPSQSPRRRSLATSQPPWTGNKRTSAASALQSNRQMLEALMKERSRAVANLSTPSPSSVKSRQDSPRMSPAPIRANHSLARASISRRSSITSDTESDASQPDTFERISQVLNGEEAARLDAMVRHVIDMSPPADVRESSSSPRHLTSSHLRLVGGHPVFRRRGSCSLDSGSSISLSDTASVTSEQESTSSTTNHIDDELPAMSRLRIRRGTICMGSLSAMVASAPGESVIRLSSSSPCPSKNLSHRSNGDIEEKVEEEIQKNIMQRKSQLLMQAAQESVHMPPAGRNTKARAIAKTTNVRLQTTMGKLTMERTTSELITMKTAMNAAAKRRDFGGIQKSKSLDCE